MNAGKTYRRGTHRTLNPAATVARLRPLLPVLGITRVANVTGLDTTGVPVVMVCRPLARSVAVFQGKGLDLEAARASGLMEAVETWHAEHIDQPLRYGSYEELRYRYPLADPARLPLSIDCRFHGAERLLWIEAALWGESGSRWLPYELVHTDYTLPALPGSGCFAATSNGLASGNHLLEAVTHGLCEVIERDATTLWKLASATQQDAAGVALDSIDDPICRGLLDCFARAELRVGLWETTTDIAVAAFVCVLLDDRDTAQPAVGAGCHPAREVALARALTEAAQVRAGYIAGARDDLPLADYDPAQCRQQQQQVRHLLDTRQSVRDFNRVPSWQAAQFTDDLAELRQRLRQAGHEQVLVVNLTRPELQIPVVRVVVPGLEGHYEAPGCDYVPGARARARSRLEQPCTRA